MSRFCVTLHKKGQHFRRGLGFLHAGGLQGPQEPQQRTLEIFPLPISFQFYCIKLLGSLGSFLLWFVVVSLLCSSCCSCCCC